MHLKHDRDMRDNMLHVNPVRLCVFGLMIVLCAFCTGYFSGRIRSDSLRAREHSASVFRNHVYSMSGSEYAMSEQNERIKNREKREETA